MKRIFGIVSLMPLFLCAQEGIKFEEGLSWEQVKQKAKIESKYIFVDCYATWCGPCKWMDKNVYTNDTVGNLFNEKFISIKIQMDTSKTDNEFIRNWYVDASTIMRNYKVSAFPTYLFFSSYGEVVHRDVGAKGVNYMVAVGEDALNPDKQYYRVLEKYRRNELEPAYIKTLVHIVQNVEGEELAGEIANKYINRLPSDSLFTKDNIQLMYEFTKRSSERGFKIFKDHAKRISEIEKRFTESACKNFVISIINREDIKPYTTSNKGKPDWKKIKINLKKYGSLGQDAFKQYQPGVLFTSEIEPVLKVNPDWNKILPMIKKMNLGMNAEFVVGSTVVYYLNGVNYYKTEKNCKNLVAAATYYADSFPSFLNARTLNTWAWVLFEYSNDKDELNKALVWSERSIDLGRNDATLIDTYANLLYKLGRVEEAINWQEKAVQQLEIKGNKNPSIIKTLEKMKRGEKTWGDSN